jgi:Domain of unknown function (DUF4383)
VGFVIGSGESILGLIPINTQDNILHLVIGLTGLAAGLATARVASTQRRTAATAH